MYLKKVLPQQDFRIVNSFSFLLYIFIGRPNRQNRLSNSLLRGIGVHRNSEKNMISGKSGTSEIFGGTEEVRKINKNHDIQEKTGHSRNSGGPGHSKKTCCLEKTGHPDFSGCQGGPGNPENHDIQENGTFEKFGGARKF